MAKRVSTALLCFWSFFVFSELYRVLGAFLGFQSFISGRAQIKENFKGSLPYNVETDIKQTDLTFKALCAYMHARIH